jgi:hypothetical protein
MMHNRNVIDISASLFRSSAINSGVGIFILLFNKFILLGFLPRPLPVNRTHPALLIGRVATQPALLVEGAITLVFLLAIQPKTHIRRNILAVTTAHLLLHNLYVIALIGNYPPGRKYLLNKILPGAIGNIP